MSMTEVVTVLAVHPPALVLKVPLAKVELVFEMKHRRVVVAEVRAVATVERRCRY